MAPGTGDPMLNDAGGTPSFEEWVEYCFTQAGKDFWGHSDVDSEAKNARILREQRFALRPILVTQYLTRLMESPEFVADRYTDDQIGDATWQLFGIASEYFRNDVCDDRVAIDLQVRCYRAIGNMYTNLFDRVCGERGQRPDEYLTNHVDKAVFMIWDMDSVEIVLYNKQFAHLLDPALESLESALMRCRTAACRRSALHGLGHFCFDRPDLARPVIERYLRERQMPVWLREYANVAITGRIQ